LTIAQAVAASEARLDEARKDLKDGRAAYTAILLTYISMMLVFGVIPLIRGTKKIIGTMCRESEEMAETK
jgi:hypothetical protein